MNNNFSNLNKTTIIKIRKIIINKINHYLNNCNDYENLKFIICHLFNLLTKNKQCNSKNIIDVIKNLNKESYYLNYIKNATKNNKNNPTKIKKESYLKESLEIVV